MTKVFVLILALSLGMNSGCRRCSDPSNPECKNYDPCYGKSETKAIMELVFYNDIAGNEVFDGATVDSILGPVNTPIKFVYPGSAKQVIWILGLDTFNKKEVTTAFSALPQGGPYPVTLIVNREPNGSCFPNDDGWDTLTRNFYVVGMCDLKVSGGFRMLKEGTKDSVDVYNQWIKSPHLAFRDSCNTTTLRSIGVFSPSDTGYLLNLSAIDHSLMITEGQGDIRTFRFNYLPASGSYECMYTTRDHPQPIRFHGRKMD